MEKEGLIKNTNIEQLAEEGRRIYEEVMISEGPAVAGGGLLKLFG